MSVAFDLSPVVDVPDRARRPERAPATVTRLYAPDVRSTSVPMRLTRRGRLALSVGVALAAVALLGAAWLSGPGRSTGSSSDRAGTVAAPALVVVRSGDTLWSIASRVAPDRDPRAEVADLQRLNGLSDAQLGVGQELRTR
jgi:hypothetical protein